MSIKSSARLKKRRAGEPWVSNNRVLSGGNNNTTSSSSTATGNNNNSSSSNAATAANAKRAANIGRNPNFDTDETKLLIQLWGDPKLQRTLITTHKKHVVICQLAAKMEEYGYHRSPEEITTRIKNLKCFYNRLKKEMESGQASEPSWKHFAEMDAIMTRPIFSVRPNEVPAPSIKFQIEQAREEREERRKKLREENSVATDSENDDDEDVDDDDDMLVAALVAKNAKTRTAAITSSSNATTTTTATTAAATTKHDCQEDGIIPDVEVDMEINEETFAAFTGVVVGTVTTTTSSSIATRSKKRKISRQHDAEEADVVVDDVDIKDEPDSNDDCSVSPTTAEKSQVSNKENAEKQKSPKKESSGALIVPKEEPIDVDSDSNDKETPTSSSSTINTLNSTLADFLQMSKQNVMVNAAGNVCIPVSSMSTIAMSRAAPVFGTVTTTVATPGTITTPQQGKISLVPTNFLMQPKPAATPPTGVLKQPQIQYLQSTKSVGGLQQRILLSSAPQTPGTTPTTQLVATRQNGVKLLVVNAADQAAGAKTVAAANHQLTPVSAASVLGKSAMLPLGATLQQLQPTHTINLQKHQTIANKAAAESMKPEQQESVQKHKTTTTEKQSGGGGDEQMSKRDATSIRILLRQLLNSQNENNEIQHNRLSLERERLDWEKALGERLLQLLPALLQPHQHQQQQQQQQQQPTTVQVQSLPATVSAISMPSQQQQFIAAQVCSQAHTAVQQQQQQQRVNPPKLVFTTTALPTANGGTTTLQHILTPTTPNLTASLPKITNATSSSPANNPPVEICTQINDIQLVTPKVEQEQD